MSDPDMNDTGSNASGSQTGDSAQTWDSVDSGQSEDIENSLTGQGYSDRVAGEETEAVDEGEAAASDDSARPVRGVDREPGGGGGGGGI